MSGIGRTVGKIAGIVGTVASFIPGGQVVAAAAFAVSAIASIAFPQKKPPVPGSLTDITIGANMQSLYPMGRTYPRLAMIHDVGYGPTTNDVPNPYRSMVFDLGTGGPLEEIEAIQADFDTITFSAGEATGYYENFLWADTQLGECPESSALAGPHGAIPDWGASYKLSGHGAMLLTLKFDRKGKRWASGVPQFGAIVKGVLVYDPRQDSTFPGGSGACRALDEDTYVGTTAALNPGCHGVTYALGRFQNGKKVFGCGFAEDQIDWPAWVEFMNTCDANGWKIGGTIFEPGSRWDNLKRICQAGGGKPVFSGGLLSVTFPRPRVALDTIESVDLVGPARIPAMKGWRDRLNGIVPKYPSEAHKWEMVQSDLVSVSTYVTADGEEKNEERDYECVPYKDQAAQLAAYDLTNARELAPITMAVKPRLIRYRIGECLEVGSTLAEETGLAEGQLLVITGRRVNPEDFSVELTFETETTAKHAYALGQTGTAPPTPSLPTPEEQDEAAWGGIPSTPDSGDWAITATSLTSVGGELPALTVEWQGAEASPLAISAGLTGVQFGYRTSGIGAIAREGDVAGLWLREDGSRILLENSVAAGDWFDAMMDAPDTVHKVIGGLVPSTTYDVSIRYANDAGLSDRLILGPATVGALIPASSAAVGVYDEMAITDLFARVAALEEL